MSSGRSCSRERPVCGLSEAASYDMLSGRCVSDTKGSLLEGHPSGRLPPVATLPVHGRELRLSKYVTAVLRRGDGSHAQRWH